MTKMESIINKIIDIIRKNNNFVILSHDNLDGDSLGSGLALGFALRSMDKKVKILINEPIPEKYKFLPGINTLVAKYSFLKNKKNSKTNVLITLDTAGLNQMGHFNPKQFEKQTIVNIDHHIDNKRFGHINWIDPKASAVGEQIYTLIKNMPSPITTNIAICLYTAILTDTGSFQFSNTTPMTHKIVSNLLNFKVFPRVITKHVYGNIPLSKLKLLNLALDTVKTQNQIIWIWVTNKMLNDSNAKPEDIEGFIDKIKSVTNIKVAILFRETQKTREIRVTFRSKNPTIHVNKIAHKFGGGGHKAAAGCTIYGNRKQIENKVLKEVKKRLKH